MKVSKYEGLLLDGRWKFKTGSSTHNIVTFVNIYNGNEIQLTYKQVEDVINGRNTVSRIMCRRIGNQGHFETNNTVSWWKKTKAKYSKGR